MSKACVIMANLLPYACHNAVKQDFKTNFWCFKKIHINQKINFKNDILFLNMY